MLAADKRGANQSLFRTRLSYVMVMKSSFWLCVAKHDLAGIVCDDQLNGKLSHIRNEVAPLS